VLSYVTLEYEGTLRSFWSQILKILERTQHKEKKEEKFTHRLQHTAARCNALQLNTTVSIITRSGKNHFIFRALSQSSEERMMDLP